MDNGAPGRILVGHPVRMNEDTVERRPVPVVSCSILATSGVRSLLVVRPGAPSTFLFLVAMPFAPSSILAPS